MKEIKDMIMRRRPTSDPAQTPPPVSRRTSRVSRPAPEAERDDLGKDFYLEAARAARNHVPSPQRPTVHNQPDWSKPADVTPRRVAPAPQSPAPTAEKADTPPATPKIWDLQPPQTSSAQDATPEVETVERAKRLVSREKAPRRVASDRVKTRLLGFHGADMDGDLFASEVVENGGAAPFFPIGWLVIVDGPGRGASFTLTAGLSTLGRDATQTVCLDFGDTSISREKHASIAYDEEDRRTYVGHGGKSNIVRLNDKPLLSTEELNDGDHIRIGKTTLRYVGFCDQEFAWVDESDGDG